MINNYAVLDNGHWLVTIFAADDQDIDLINDIVTSFGGTGYVNETLYPYPNGFAANWNSETNVWDVDYTITSSNEEVPQLTEQQVIEIIENNN